MLLKRIVIAGVTVILLAAFMLYGTDYVRGMVMRSGDTQKLTLSQKINIANRSITKIPEPDQQAALELADLEQEIKKEAQVFPRSMDTALIINSLLELAKTSEVTVVPLQTSDWTAKGNSYKVYTVTLLVEGDYDKIVPFIGHLENELFANLTITALEVTHDTTGDETALDSARLSLAIYIGA